MTEVLGEDGPAGRNAHLEDRRENTQAQEGRDTPQKPMGTHHFSSSYMQRISKWKIKLINVAQPSHFIQEKTEAQD